jgi:hypothetical protein
MNSITQLSNIIDNLQDNGKAVTYKKLRQRGPRKGETMQRNSQHGRGQALGNVQGGDRQTASHSVGSGKGGTITRVTGIGKEMVKDLHSVQQRYQQQVKADRRAAALERRSN